MSSAVEHGYLTRGNGGLIIWYFNDHCLEDCNGLHLVNTLNYLGLDGWQFAGKIDENQYILIRK